MRYLNVGSKGPYVMQIQSILKKLGYFNSKIDGIYGPKTADAVKKFQHDYGLFISGGVDFITWDILDRYIYGFDNYRIQEGDTLYKIAKLYATDIDLIRSANPNVNELNLQNSSYIVVPYKIDIVPIDIEYTYEICQKIIKGLKVRYPFIEIGSAGKSVLGKNLDYVCIGTGPNKVFINAAHHAIEWITTPLVLKFAEDLLKRNINDSYLMGHRIRDVLNRTSLYVVPMVNPDGVDLANEGLNNKNPYYDELISFHNKGVNFHSQWKANIRGVDLNKNYPANWENEKAQEIAEGITKPAPAEFGGDFPLSEPETIGMVGFTNRNGFDLTIAYHTQGKVIYWAYGSSTPNKARAYAEKFQKVSGYTLKGNPSDAAYAGYKDWFIETHKKPGFTVEAGIGANPLLIEQFGQIYRDNELLMFSALL